MKKLLLSLLLGMCVQGAIAQSKTFTGTVLDPLHDPVIGATVQLDGTDQKTVTDLDGKFSFSNVPSDATVTITYLGMKPITQKLTGESMTFNMEDEETALNEVVVIGYGTAKAKDLTSPIVVVKGDELTNVPSSSPMSAIQGKVSGVNVVNNGVPGSGPTVKIRGNGSFANATPLYVVDGMFYDNINFLDASDIQEMSVLKDASASAIYGVRAANGVVLITTKKGVRRQSAQITYDGYVGVQHATNRLEMASSNEYASMLMEADYDSYSPYAIASIERYGGSHEDADFHNWTYGSDTDWYKELLRDALITKHSVGISGGGEKASYSVGVSYLYQDGIMDVDNDYSRVTTRAALDYDATNWLKVGFNGIFTNSQQQLANNAAWQQAYNAPGLYPVYDENNTEAYPESYAAPSSVGYTNNFYNPVATANYYDSDNDTKQFNTNFYAQFQLIPEKLNFRSSINYEHSTMEARTFTPKYYVSEQQQNSTTSLVKSTTTFNNYIWDNTLTYTDHWGKHNFGAMLGFSMREENYRYLMGSRSNVPDTGDETKYIGLGDEDTDSNGDAGYTYRGISYFGRLNYNYADKYLLMFTMRADGSSKYQEHWGYFPSVGAAWVVSQEPFFKNQNVIDYLKIRASWGKLGNDRVAASDGFASVTTGNSASGVFGDNIYPGYQNNIYFSYLRWEVVEESNVGFNMAMFSNRLNMDVDYYHRMTKHAVISPRLPFENRTLAGNYGKILNQGIDVSINWDDQFGDVKYHIGTNLSFLWNEVKSLSGTTFIQGGKTVNWVGHEMNSFYGYIVEGIYQNEEEVANDPIAVANDLEPGDFKYKDLNGDDVIDNNDKTTLGAYLPNFTFGINLGMEWKGLDVSLSTYGQTGAQLYNRKRALRYSSSLYNFDHDQYVHHWTGEGSTNEYPSAKALTKTWNVGDQYVNSYLVEDADFFRIQNITVGYTFKNIKMGSYTMPSLRLSLTADRPCTWFSANSFTPEISDSEGWDTEVYPLTATYTFGLQIQF
ncbi:MAG: SusC/RagA family TonB-linked outer membrane protein [Prevotella sp.]|jgi:TonB-linked SusC/RagA family outer membrane protein